MIQIQWNEDSPVVGREGEKYPLSLAYRDTGDRLSPLCRLGCRQRDHVVTARRPEKPVDNRMKAERFLDNKDKSVQGTPKQESVMHLPS
jgi:hypothetical protein